MTTQGKLLVGLAAAGVAVGAILLLRRQATAAPAVTAPALPEVAPQAAYSGFVAGNATAPPSSGGGSFASVYGSAMGAGTTALCNTKTGGNPLCAVAGSLSSKFSGLVGGAYEKVGSTVWSGTKSVFSKINPF